MAAITTREFTKGDGEVIPLDHLELSVREWTVFGFISSNGAGESTAINRLVGFLSPAAGSGTILGHAIVCSAVLWLIGNRSVVYSVRTVELFVSATMLARVTAFISAVTSGGAYLAVMELGVTPGWSFPETVSEFGRAVLVAWAVIFHVFGYRRFRSADDDYSMTLFGVGLFLLTVGHAVLKLCLEFVIPLVAAGDPAVSFGVAATSQLFDIVGLTVIFYAIRQ